MLMYVSTRNEHIFTCQLSWLFAYFTWCKIHAESSHLAISWPKIVCRIPFDCVWPTKDVKYNDNGKIRASGDVVDCARLASRMVTFQQTSHVFLRRFVEQQKRQRQSQPCTSSNNELDVFEGFTLAKPEEAAKFTVVEKKKLKSTARQEKNIYTSEFRIICDRSKNSCKRIGGEEKKERRRGAHGARSDHFFCCKHPKVHEKCLDLADTLTCEKAI